MEHSVCLHTITGAAGQPDVGFYSGGSCHCAMPMLVEAAVPVEVEHVAYLFCTGGNSIFD